MKTILLPLGLVFLLQTSDPAVVQQPVSMEDVTDDGYQGPPQLPSHNVRWATAEDFDGSVPFCIGFFTSIRVAPSNSGTGWWTDYPNAGENYQKRVQELTTIRTGPPVVVRLTDPLLARCPWVMLSDVGGVSFSEAEVLALRAYLEKGGFLWADDFWGFEDWAWWTSAFAQVLDAPWTPIPADHPILSMVYAVPSVPQIPSIEHWRWSFSDIGQSWGPDWRHSELGPKSANVFFAGISDARGRLVAISTHNSDIADSWERETHEREYFIEYSPKGYGLGINVVVYVLTH